MGDAFDSDVEGSGSAVACCFVEDDVKSEAAGAFDSFAATFSDGLAWSAMGFSYSSSNE